MKILFLSRWFPYPANNGSKLRIFNLLIGLSKHHEVTLLSFIDPSDPQPDEKVVEEICSECYTVPWREFDPSSRRASFGFLSPKPRFILDTHSSQMENEITRLTSEVNYHLIIASQLTMAAYHESFGNIPAVFEEIELGGFYEQSHLTGSTLKRMRYWLTWLKLKAYLGSILKSFAICTVVSEKEKKLFIGTFPQYQARAEVYPNFIDLKEYRIANLERRKRHLIFSGSFRYSANYQAMLWFLENVYPLILEHVSDTQLLITGDHAGLPLPMTKNIQLTGHVKDIRSLIASCDVSIVPIWNGGGTRLKILEAMALGTPVVSTSKGAEGLLAKEGKQILIADEPEIFASDIIQLLLDREFNRQIASNALQLVKEQYDAGQIMPRFLQMIENAALGSS